MFYRDLWRMIVEYRRCEPLLLLAPKLLNFALLFHRLWQRFFHFWIRLLLPPLLCVVEQFLGRQHNHDRRFLAVVMAPVIWCRYMLFIGHKSRYRKVLVYNLRRDWLGLVFMMCCN